MSKYRFLLIMPLIAIMLAAWYVVGSNNGTKLKKQRELLAQAAAYAKDEVYVKAVPLVVDAYNIDTEIRYTEIEHILMDYYLKGGYTEEYFSVVNDRINGGRADKNEYLKLAEYYIDSGERKKGLDVLEKGILKFDGEQLPQHYGINGLSGKYSSESLFTDELTEMYDANRYNFSLAMFSFKELDSYDGKYMTVRDSETNLWALYSSSGKMLTDYIYTEATGISSKGYASVKLDNEYLLVNSSGVRYALCKDSSVTGLVRTEGENRTTVICSDNKMYMATDLVLGKKGYDFIGAASEGFRAVCLDEQWAFSGTGDDKLEISCEEIKVNSYDEAVVSGRVFVKTGGVYKMADASGNIFENSFDDAKPFCSGGRLAAVKSGEKWGFADKSGNIVISCVYDDANSFCQGNVGFVKCDDEKWRIIDVRGNIIDKYEFSDVREFRGNSAAVKGVEEKWSIIRAE